MSARSIDENGASGPATTWELIYHQRKFAEAVTALLAAGSWLHQRKLLAHGVRIKKLLKNNEEILRKAAIKASIKAYALDMVSFSPQRRSRKPRQDCGFPLFGFSSSL